jgi:hypothetical protein
MAVIPTFTLLCDPFSPIANGGGASRQAMQAHLVLTAILFGELRLTDTQCLTSGNLADLLLSNAVTRELLSEGICQVALRDRAFGGEPLNGLQALIGSFSSNAFIPEYAETFDKCAKMLERSAVFVPWTMDGVSAFYTRNTLDLLGFGAKQLGYDDTELQNALLDFLSGKLDDSGGFLKRDFLRLAAPEALRRAGHAVPADFVQFLENVSSAYYFSAIPSFVGATVVYETSHKGILALRDGTHLDLEEVVDILDVPSPIDLRFLTDGLCLLDVDDVLGLIRSREAVAYRNSLKIHIELSTGASLFEVRKCLFELQSKVDETILNRDGRFRADTTRDNVRRSRTLIDAATGATTLAVTFATKLLDVTVPGLGVMIGLPAKGYRNQHYGDNRLVSENAARRRAIQQAYEDRMRHIGKTDAIRLRVSHKARETLVELEGPSFLAT